MVPSHESPALDFLQHKQHMISELRENLAQAQARMIFFADNKRPEREFQVGDLVYLKL
jgi:hypothetical protein